MRPSLTVVLPNFGSPFAPGEWRRFLDLARAAEGAGVDRIQVVDHVVMGRDLGAYVWGRFPTAPDAPWLEPLTTLAAVAGVTERVRLATGVLIAPLRPAPLLAKAAATLDVLSGGRLDLGVGVGWQRAEYEAVGLPFERRGQLLTDTIAACRTLWRDSPATFASETVRFRDVFCEPKPLQPGGVPVWVAGSLRRRTLDRVVRLGDGWIPIMGATLDQVAEGARRIREGLREAGRNPRAVRIQAPLPVERGPDGRPSLPRSLERVGDLVAAGATDVSVFLGVWCREPAGADRFLRQLVAGFSAALR